MSIDKEYVKEALLRWNYFPNQKKQAEELPPIYTTKNLVPPIADKLLSLKLETSDGYEQVEYLATRYNNVSRPLTLPHPLPYIRLVDCIVNNWDDFEYITDNKNSFVKPDEYADKRLIVMDYGDDYSSTDQSLDLSFGSQFCVKTDISNCFPSIYTHSIPWGLVGYKKAKKERSDKKKYFNELDFYQRLTKRNETLGVSIGPGTSNVLVESILARIDEKLASKYKYYRYIDDYTCYCKTYDEAQGFIQALREELKSYKLTLNIKKTSISELPTPIDDDWLVELNTRLPNGSVIPKENHRIVYNATEAVRYLDYALGLNKRNQDGSILKFAVKSVLYKLAEDSKETILKYLLNLCRFYPVLIPLLDYLFEQDVINAKDYESHLNILIEESAKNLRSDGMSWCLYFLDKFKLDISDSASNAVVTSKDCFGLLGLYQLGGFNTQLIFFIWSLDSDDRHEIERYWLLIYQMYFDGIVIYKFGNDDTFKILKKYDVSFIKRNTQTKIERKYDMDGLFADVVTGVLDKTKSSRKYSRTAKS